MGLPLVIGDDHVIITLSAKCDEETVVGGSGT